MQNQTDAGTGGRVRALRDERGLSREELAVKAGVSYWTVVGAEQGRRGMQVSTVRKIAEALDVPLSEILD